jgi:hypothetical protein
MPRQILFLKVRVARSGKTRGSLNQTEPDSVSHGFGAMVNMKLLQDILNVIADGVVGDEEGLGNLTGAIAFRQKR